MLRLGNCVRPAGGSPVRATAALLEVEHTRPPFACVAEHNIASRKVLTHADFIEIDRETSYADGVAREIVERIYSRDR